jgi:hypothetical protein
MELNISRRSIGECRRRADDLPFHWEDKGRQRLHLDRFYRDRSDGFGKWILP